MTIEGHIENGKVILDQEVALPDGMKVRVELLNSSEAPPQSGSVDLRARGMNEEQAADLRHRLKSMSADWDRPEMDVYDAI